MAEGPNNSREDQIQEYANTFIKFDKDRDGRLSRDELQTLLKSIGQKQSKAEVNAILKRADKDKNGTIDFSEFMIMMKEMEEQIGTSLESSSEDFKETFDEFDRDRNGLITVKEFKKGMAKRGERMSEKYFRQMMKEGDLDGDGCINYEEFVRMMSQ